MVSEILQQCIPIGHDYQRELLQHDSQLLRSAELCKKKTRKKTIAVVHETKEINERERKKNSHTAREKERAQPSIYIIALVKRSK